MNLKPDAATIAHFALELQYDDIDTLDALTDFAHSFDRSTLTTLRAKLIDIIDLDLYDMLHNSNFDFYASLDETDALTDDELDTLADHLLDTIDPALTADMLLSRILR